MLVGWTVVSLMAGLTGCWAGDRAELPDEPTRWAPVAGDLDDSWVIDEIPTTVDCPDGDPARLWLAHPSTPSEPMPVAVVFPGGAFDYPTTASSTDTDGDTDTTGGAWRSPTRLDRDWADRRAWAVLGMYASDDAAITHTGAMPLALAERDHAVLVVPNCWGDYGANDGDNDQAADGFARRGRALGTIAWRLVTQDGFAAGEQLPLPIPPAYDEAVLVGLAQGGRGVGELLHDPTVVDPAAVILDSVDDDLGVYYDAPEVWVEELEGLSRIWPAGRAAALARRVSTASLPAESALVVSAADPRLPAGIVDAVASAVTNAGGTVTDTGQTVHVQTASDLELSRTVVGQALGAPPDDDTDATDDTDG